MRFLNSSLVSGLAASWQLRTGVGALSLGSLAVVSACGSSPAVNDSNNDATAGSGSASSGSSGAAMSGKTTSSGAGSGSSPGSGSGSGTVGTLDGAVSGDDATVGSGSDVGDASAPETASSGGSDGSVPTGFAVITNRYDNFRLGANTSETTLNVANVGGGKFGLLFSHQVDGHLYAQPLYLPGLVINGAAHNVVFVATEHDSVYAFDAESASATPLWQVSLGTPMDDVPGAGTGHPLTGNQTVTCRDMFPKTGITSTPVIDRATGRMYVVAKTFEAGIYHQRLHALDVLTGKDVAGSPVEISGSVHGTGVGGDDAGTVPFSAYHHLNRPGLLLTGGNIFIAFASHCDDPPYHGWVFAYSADTLTQKGIYNTTPNGTQGGIWQSGMGLVGDQNDVYFVSGNGDFDPTNTGTALGLSVGHLKLSVTGLNVADWWTANNATALNAHDVDLTSAAVLLPNPKVMVAGGKDGNFYVFDPANLGKYSAAANNILQTVPTAAAATQAHIHGGPVYWNGPSGPTLYIWPQGATLRSYGFTGSKITTTPLSEHVADVATHPGGVVSLSSDGATKGTGVLWATFTSGVIDPVGKGDAWHNLVPGAFFAFDATNLSTPIWTSLANKARDDLGIFAKFNPPVVANGRVYVASQMTPDGGKLLVYGLLP